MKLIISCLNLLLAQNAAQKNETFLLLAVFALVACGFIAGAFGGKPFTKEKQVQKPLLVIAVMMLFVFFVVYFLLINK